MENKREKIRTLTKLLEDITRGDLQDIDIDLLAMLYLGVGRCHDDLSVLN